MNVGIASAAVSMFALVVVLSSTSGTVAQEQSAMRSSDTAAAEQMIAGWPNRPKLGARQMLKKYGAPQEATAEMLVWHNQGPFKFITVTKAEHHHDFPKPHMDYMEHTISYMVPAQKAMAIAEFDGSLTYDRTRGEMSARCDLEGHNMLTLNLGHDLATGKTDPAGARKSFSDIVVDDMKGKYPPYTTALRFEPKKDGAMFVDVPTIPGSPKRVMGNAVKADAEVLGLLGAVNENEIVASMEVHNKKISGPVGDYAKKLHMEHGQNLEATLMLGQKINVTPAESPAVDKVRVKGAGELAMLIVHDGDKFAAAYVDAMVKGHTEVLAMIDNDLMKRAEHEGVKTHLAATRASVAKHLDEAKALQGRGTR